MSIQGVVTRGRQGNASNDNALAFEGMVVPLAEAGLEYIARASKTDITSMLPYTPRAKKVLKEVKEFVEEKVIPVEKVVLWHLYVLYMMT